MLYIIGAKCEGQWSYEPVPCLFRTQVQHGFDVVWIPNIKVTNDIVMYIHTSAYVVTGILASKVLGVVFLNFGYIVGQQLSLLFQDDCYVWVFIINIIFIHRMRITVESEKMGLFTNQCLSLGMYGLKKRRPFCHGLYMLTNEFFLPLHIYEWNSRNRAPVLLLLSCQRTHVSSTLHNNVLFCFVLFI